MMFSDKMKKLIPDYDGRKTPFTIYESMIPQCKCERDLRNRGLKIINRNYYGFSIVRPNTKITEESFYENNAKKTRITYQTNAGNLTTLSESNSITTWTHEYLFKSPDDYRALRAYFADENYLPDYESVTNARKWLGNDVILRGALMLEPLQMLISSNLMGMQDFCIEWMDNRDEIMKIYDIIVEKRRLLYPIVAASPHTHVNYGGNVTPGIITPEMFEELYLPHYGEAAEIMHRHGKLIGCHFDANCRLIADLIAKTPLDYIEAFTPAPDTDMSLSEARQAWPDKILWLNFPSSVHLREDSKIEQFTIDMLESIGSRDGIIMGITEDMPGDRWQGSCTAIMNALEK